MEYSCDSRPLEIRLFGHFEVRIDGRPLPPLRTRKGQWLLALLVLKHERPVDRAWLAGTLWPDTAEKQAFASLRKSLSDLRHALGAHAYRLYASTPCGLGLDLSGVEVDVLAFDRTAAQNEECALREAIVSYRGALLPECAEEWIVLEREAREQAYLRALEVVAATAIERGDVTESARLLRLCVAADPMRETAQRALMRALAIGGNFAEATQVYRELRLYLHRELNAEPDPETAAVYHELRAASRYRSRPHLAPPLSMRPSSLSPSSLQIPRPLTELIGRDNEVREVAVCLSKARLVTLTGAGGIGKTRLAIRVMEELVEEYAAGVWFADLSTLSDPHRIPQTIASVLQIREQPNQPLIETLADFLGARPLLLVLDNCEHLIDACARLAHRLLEVCPPLRILATSRQSLGIAGEVVWRVPALSVPDTACLSTTKDLVSRMLEYDAVRLLVNRALLGQPAFRLDAGNARKVARICCCLEGIPLAIEMAAAQMKMLSTEEIAARLEVRFALPRGGSRTAPARHQTLQATIDWSCGLLSEAERILLRRLSVFVGGWSLEAAETVCADENLPGRTIFDQLANLVDKSLVGSETAGGRTRYRMLEMVRQYGSEQLVAHKELAALRSRHAAWYAQFAEAAAPNLEGAEHAVWLERLETEQDNVRAVLEWCVAEAEAAVGLRIAGSIWRFWAIRGHPGEGREWLTRFLVLSRGPVPTSVRQRALFGAGVLAYFQADYRAAYTVMQESLILAWRFGDGHGMATALSNLGIIVLNEGNYARARRFYQESLRIARELEDRPGIAKTLTHLGSAARAEGAYDEASALLEEALKIAQEMGERDGICTLINHLGLVKQSQGSLLQAKLLFEEALAMSRELEDRRAIAWSLYNLANAMRLQGGQETAHALYRQSLLIRYELGDRRGIATCLEQCAGMLMEQGQAECGARLLGAFEALQEAMRINPLSSETRERAERMNRAQVEIGEEAFTAALTIGRMLSLDQAVALALEDTDACGGAL